MNTMTVLSLLSIFMQGIGPYRQNVATVCWLIERKWIKQKYMLKASAHK